MPPATYVESCLGQEPSVLIAEDVHWFDGSTLDLVMRLAGPERVCRHHDRPPGIRGPRRGRGDRAAALSEEHSGAARRRPLRGFPHRCGDPPRRGRPERRYSASYIEELVANVRQGVAVVRDEMSGRSSGAVPDLLYDLLAARLDSPNDVIPVATASAAIGRDVDGRLLQQVLDLPRAELDAALETLCACRGCSSDRDPARGSTGSATSCLREVAYELQPPSRRQLRARQAGGRTHLGGVGDDVVDWGVVASHYERARATGRGRQTPTSGRPAARCEVPSRKLGVSGQGDRVSHLGCRPRPRAGHSRGQTATCIGATWQSPRKAMPARRRRPTTSGAWS